MAKSIKVVLKRHADNSWCHFEATVRSVNQLSLHFCWPDLAWLCPEFCKGLRPGQSRELILRQTKRGISLTRLPASRKKKRGQDANITKKEG